MRIDAHQTNTSFKSPMRNPQSKASAHASNHRAPQGLSQRAVREIHHVSGLHLLHCGVHRGPHVLVKHVSFKCSSVHSCASLTCFLPCWHLYIRATTVHVKTCTLRSGTHPPPPVHAHTLVGTSWLENPSAARRRTLHFHRRCTRTH